MKWENKMFETIYDFAPSYEQDGCRIEYRNLMEVCQGGPEVGNLWINEQLISGNRYGGPLLCHKGFVYVPVFKGSDFILSAIRLSDLESSYIGNIRGIICLKRIEGNKIYFYDSIYDDSLKYYDLSFFRKSREEDSPISFSTELLLNDHSFEFNNLVTLKNGSQIGSLSIDSKPIPSHRFGSPFLYNDSQILIPIFEQELFRSGFKLALIDIDSLNLNIVGERESFISLLSFENSNKVTYYTDVTQCVKKTIIS